MFHALPFPILSRTASRLYSPNLELRLQSLTGRLSGSFPSSRRPEQDRRCSRAGFGRAVAPSIFLQKCFLRLSLSGPGFVLHSHWTPLRYSSFVDTQLKQDASGNTSCLDLLTHTQAGVSVYKRSLVLEIFSPDRHSLPPLQSSYPFPIGLAQSTFTQNIVKSL